MLNLLTLAALGLASYRGTQLIVHDSIGDPIRDRLELWHAKRHDSKLRSFVRDLLTCTYCTGAHVSWILLVTYLLVTGQWGDAPVLVHALEASAVAGIQALLNRLDDTMGGGH